MTMSQPKPQAQAQTHAKPQAQTQVKTKNDGSIRPEFIVFLMGFDVTVTLMLQEMIQRRSLHSDMTVMLHCWQAHFAKFAFHTTCAYQISFFQLALKVISVRSRVISRHAVLFSECRTGALG
jgi:hypothetical protein